MKKILYVSKDLESADKKTSITYLDGNKLRQLCLYEHNYRNNKRKLIENLTELFTYSEDFGEYMEDIFSLDYYLYDTFEDFIDQHIVDNGLDEESEEFGLQGTLDYRETISKEDYDKAKEKYQEITVNRDFKYYLYDKIKDYTSESEEVSIEKLKEDFLSGIFENQTEDFKNEFLKLTLEDIEYLNYLQLSPTNKFLGDSDTWEEIEEEIKNLENKTPEEQEEFLNKHNVAEKYSEYLDQVSTEGYSVIDGRLYRKDEEIDSILYEIIEKVALEQRDLDEEIYKSDSSLETRIFKFYDRMQDNVDPFIRNQIYSWINSVLSETDSWKSRLTFTEEGNLIGYKGVQKTYHEGVGTKLSKSEKEFCSIFSGRAVVNGTEIVGKIPMKLGDVIEMPRKAVASDPATACSYGLHVGTYNYAASFSQCDELLLMEVRPEDIVSVPTDSRAQKIRCSKYKVVDIIKR